MSLNGLDSPEIVEAHEAATSEPGGWFLLKYSSRDEVELLSRGNRGIAEMRNAVTEYDETSPLYGFLKYRRRNVVIKFLPEDCSRLIQARVAVHFNAICERFSPYDTTFEIAAASELKDTKLSAACSLHAASCSTSSSTSSLRRRRLVEIAEEEEDEQRATKRQSVQEPDGERPGSSVADASAVDTVTLDSQLAANPEHSKFSAGSTSELPTFVGVDDRPTSPAKSISADSTRTEPFTYPSYPYSKPKVKLGPRPSLDVNGRPQTAGNFRPVSAIPAGFKLFGKGSKKGRGKRDSHGAAFTKEETSGLNCASSTNVTPEEPLGAQGDTVRPATSSGLPAESSMPPPPPMSKKQTISPEKARLMKAMQMRERRKKMSMQPVSVLSSDDAAAPESNESPADDIEHNTHGGEDLPRAIPDNKNDPMETDSSVVMDALLSVAHTDQTSDATQSDSRPTSPVVASSEAEQSTKASSLSESTDETARAKDEELLVNDEDAGVEAPPEDDLVKNTQHDTLSAADASKLEENIKDTYAVEIVPDEAASTAQINQDTPTAPELEHTVAEEGASDSTITSPELLPASELRLNTSTHTHDHDCEPREIVALPMSKSSASIPSSPNPQQQALFGVVRDAETCKIPPSEPAELATTTDISDELFSQQRETLKAKVATQDLLPAAEPVTQQTTVSELLLQSVLEEGSAHPSDEPDVDKRDQEQYDSETEKTRTLADRPKRRGGFIEPIRTDLAQHSRQTSRSDAHFSDDEELMEELRSATVQEAKPMTVAKTPVSVTFPSSPIKGPGLPGAPKAQMIRTISNPVRSSLAVPTDANQTSTRSLSSGAAYLQQVAQQQQQVGNLTKKSNMGSSISQRIKALEKLSAASGEPGAPAARERPSSTFFAVKKREPSRSPSVVDRAISLRNTPEPPSRSHDVSPDAGKRTRRERSGSVTSRLSMFESPPGANSSGRATSSGRSPGNTQRGRPESVSVTAKIIRDPNQSMKYGFEPPKDPSEFSHLELTQSPLLVDHQKATREPTYTAVEPASERRSGSQERSKSSKSRQSSLSIVKDFIRERRKSVTSNQGEVLAALVASNTSRSPSRPASGHQNSAFSPRLSISSRRSSISKDRESVMSPIGDSFGDDAKSTNGDKKLSRAGRFMRRLSTLSGGRGKNSPTGISSTVTEEEISEPAMVRPATTGTPTIVSYLGDVNVQFPDNLLWKRRNLCLDSQGFLILSALPAQSGRQAQGTKRYHLTEFRAPYTPDVEIQELPNSVVLDFIEGTSIQVACEDRAEQSNVLSVLQNAHATRGSTYGL